MLLSLGRNLLNVAAMNTVTNYENHVSALPRIAPAAIGAWFEKPVACSVQLHFCINTYFVLFDLTLHFAVLAAVH